MCVLFNFFCCVVVSVKNVFWLTFVLQYGDVRGIMLACQDKCFVPSYLELLKICVQVFVFPKTTGNRKRRC